jgi:hypothetical protein
VSETQSELPLFLPGKSVKPRQLEALRLPFSVMVDLKIGGLVELHKWEMLKTDPHQQWAVPSTVWLQKLKDALAYLCGAVKQHEAERQALEEYVWTLLRESRTLTHDDMPEPEKQAVRPAVHKRADYDYIQEQITEPPSALEDDDDAFPIPF